MLQMCSVRALERQTILPLDAKRRLSPSLVELLGRGFMLSSVRFAQTKLGTRISASGEVYSPTVLSSGNQRMAHVEREKAKLLNRLKRIRGQVEAIERAVEADRECGRVLQ